MDTEDQIPPTLPLLKGGITPLNRRGTACLREAASARQGGDFLSICLLYYRQLSKGKLRTGCSGIFGSLELGTCVDRSITAVLRTPT